MKESDPKLLILYVNQSLMTASYGMKELVRFIFGVKAPERLQLKRFESVLHPIPGLRGCCIFNRKDLLGFDEGLPSNTPKRWLTEELINYYIFWT